MKRKVIQLAGRTLVVSLPSRWARSHNIKKGDEVEVEEKGNKIIVGSESELIADKGSVSVIGMDPIVTRIIGAFYKGGFDEVSIEYSADELEKVMDIVRNGFVGFEVVHQGKGSLVVKKISSIDPKEFDTMLRRMFLVLIQMGEDTVNALQKGDNEWLKTIAYMDRDVNRYADFCRRIINKYGFSEVRKGNAYYYIIEQLERIGDSYRDICNLTIRDNIQVSEAVVGLLGEVNLFFKGFYELFYSFDLKKLCEYGKKKYELIDKLVSVPSKIDKKQYMIGVLIYTLLDNTSDMNGVLMISNLRSKRDPLGNLID